MRIISQGINAPHANIDMDNIERAGSFTFPSSQWIPLNASHWTTECNDMSKFCLPGQKWQDETVCSDWVGGQKNSHVVTHVKREAVSPQTVKRWKQTSLVIAFLFDLFLIFQDRSQWTQPLDNSIWNNSYKWESLWSFHQLPIVAWTLMLLVWAWKGRRGSEGTTLTNIGCLCKLTKMACCLFVCEAVAGWVCVHLHQCESETRGG